MNSSETKTAPPIIELSHVDKHFGQLHVLKDISLSVKKGEVVVIIGPSGSGKSTAAIRTRRFLQRWSRD